MALSEELQTRLHDVVYGQREEQITEGYVIKTLYDANKAMAKITDAKATLADIDSEAKRIIEAVKAWQVEASTPLLGKIEYYEQHLRTWAVGQIKGKTKSIKLLRGTVGFRATTPQYQQNTETLLSWVETNKPELIKTERSTDWAKLKSKSVIWKGQLVLSEAIEVLNDDCHVVNGHLVNQDGEVVGQIVPGVTVVEPPDAFYVKPKMDKQVSGLEAQSDGTEGE
jgi:hypothetical protein